ncbi:MAG: hypothetical protein E7376_03610 [Clostridiales bacterium]|nr:hypothetical protein [Clostridiales bacterium]
MIFAIKYEEKKKITKEQLQKTNSAIISVGVLDVYFKSSKEANITAKELSKAHLDDGIMYSVFRVSKNAEKFIPKESVVNTSEEFYLLYEQKLNKRQHKTDEIREY